MANPKEPEAPPGAPPQQPAPARAAAPAAPPPPPTPPPPPPPPRSPYTGRSEMIPGGRFIDGATLRGDQLYGGRIKDAQGKTLATFGPDQVNTGMVEDGTAPEA